MMISRSNYEIFFVDYLDGRLDENQKTELFDFLEENADLKEELKFFSESFVVPDKSVVFNDKEKLKRQSITLLNYKTWLTAYFENDLLGDQKNEMEVFLDKNPSAKRELEILKQTRLLPDYRIIFLNKNSLRKGRVIYMTPFLKRTIAVAASLLIFAIAYYFIRETASPVQMLSKNESPVEKQPASSNDQSSHSSDKTNESPLSTHKQTKQDYKRVAPVIVPKKQIISRQEIARRENENIDSARIAEPQKVRELPVAESKKEELQQQVALQNLIPQTQQKKSVLPQRNLSDVFTAEDLKEMGVSAQIADKKTSTLADLAADEIQRISKATKISFEKQKEDSGRVVTYALAVGKNFSVSHTRGQ